jgi:hypothetical protein
VYCGLRRTFHNTFCLEAEDKHDKETTIPSTCQELRDIQLVLDISTKYVIIYDVLYMIVLMDKSFIAMLSCYTCCSEVALSSQRTRGANQRPPHQKALQRRCPEPNLPNMLNMYITMYMDM